MRVVHTALLPLALAVILARTIILLARMLVPTKTPILVLTKGSWMNAEQLFEVSIKSHYCYTLLNWTALPPPLLRYL
jgi:uncharacterized protein involved in cysteine biosynthesis